FFLNKWQRSRGLNNKNIIIIGYNANVQSLVNLIYERKDYGLSLVQHFKTNDKNGHQFFEIEILKETLSQKNIDYIYICLNNGLEEKVINEITNLAESHFIWIGFIPDNIINSLSLEINYLDSFPILTYKKYPLDNSFNQISKRFFDIGFTTVI